MTTPKKTRRWKITMENNALRLTPILTRDFVFDETKGFLGDVAGIPAVVLSALEAVFVRQISAQPF